MGLASLPLHSECAVPQVHCLVRWSLWLPSSPRLIHSFVHRAGAVLWTGVWVSLCGACFSFPWADFSAQNCRACEKCVFNILSDCQSCPDGRGSRRPPRCKESQSLFPHTLPTLGGVWFLPRAILVGVKCLVSLHGSFPASWGASDVPVF